MRKKVFGPEHHQVAIPLNWLARINARKGNAEKAQQLYQQALGILQKTFGTDHPDVAFSLHDLGNIALHNGEYEKAEGYYQDALKTRERLVGQNHLDVAEVLSGLAWLARVKGEAQKAIQYQLQANEINESNLRRNLTVGSEKQKLKYLTLFANLVNDTLVLQTQTAPTDKTALRLALETLLRSKGRGLEAMSNSFATLRERANPEEKVLFDNLLAQRSRLANLSLRGLGGEQPDIYRAQLKQLEDETEHLEAELSRRSTEFRAELQPVTVAAVQAALPAEATLIEFTTYQPYDQNKKVYSAPHYLAYVLNPKGDINWKDLGEAAPLDQIIATFRQSLQDERRTDAAMLARQLDEKVMQPVRALVSDAKHLLVSPDGALNLIPFAALRDENKRYLVEQYQFTYLTSGRDLLRLQTQANSDAAPVIVANPDFGQQLTGEATRSTASILANTTFTPLPGTAAEAQAIKTILPRAELLTKNQATEAALKQLHAPSILHIATHGFFLAEATTNNQTRGQRKLLQTAAPGSLSDKDIVMANPLLRSGLGLAGANQAKQGSEDGILTALEATGLNLHGTKLVVLSACDTGVGEVKNGDGVHGLRRALVLAGAETQVMSLWPVSDQGTRDLMTRYYKALQAGAGRSAALRQVQLSLLQRKDRQHPFYWASFIVSGEWGNLTGKR
jgi:CHAT domain-containing protein